MLEGMVKRQWSNRLRARLILNELPTRVNLQEFESLIDTGDMIFFKSRTLGGKVQRFMTNSEFDHVGLALKFRKPDDAHHYQVKLYVLEATGINGVDIFSWDQFVANGFHMVYEEMAVRHLYAVNG